MSTSLNFDPNGLYIVLSDIGAIDRFHWGLYLATSEDIGVIFHLTNPPNSSEWIYETRTTSNMRQSVNLLVATKIAVIDPVLGGIMPDRLAQIPIQYSARFREDITCRVWLKEALFALDEEGFIKLTASVDDVENESKVAALTNKFQRTKGVIKSGPCGTLPTGRKKFNNAACFMISPQQLIQP
ncbi:hypothetical protein FQN54_001054 [Arachnomyces sp. PD_36]|nr:hypothetical protein FQN54_001054 [Arachnomyces sp. PD_36]